MNLSQLEVLVAIVETGSLTEAAETVNLTQSAVSHSLNRLEAELGVTLLERGRQGVTVTRIGDEILQHARAILSQTEIIRQKANQERGLTVGKLRFGCIRSVAGSLLTGIMRNFQQQYPDIDVVLFEGTSPELLDWLAEGVIDVGTVIEPEGYMAAVPLAKNELQLIVADDHPLAKQPHITMAMLEGLPIIGPKTEYSSMIGLLRQQNIPIPQLRHAVSTFITILAMVRENMGVAITPSMLTASQLEGVVALPFEPPLFVNVYLAANTESPAAQVFLAEAHAWAKASGYLSD